MSAVIDYFAMAGDLATVSGVAAYFAMGGSLASIVMAFIFCKLWPLHRENVRLTRENVVLSQKSRSHDLWLVRYQAYVEMLEFWENKRSEIEEIREQAKGGLYEVDEKVLLKAAGSFILLKTGMRQKLALIFNDKALSAQLLDYRTQEEAQEIALYQKYHKSVFDEEIVGISEYTFNALRKCNEVHDYFVRKLALKD